MLLLVTGIFNLVAQNVKQGFNDENSDDWNFSTNIPFYSLNNDTDVWKQKSSNGRVDHPHSGPKFLAGRDLDNPHSESVTGTASPEHILTFDPVYIGGLGAEVSFDVHYVGLDKGDYIYYQIAYNNGTSWTSYDYMEYVFKTNQSGDFNSRGWEEFKHTVPLGYNYVRMRLVIYQNGNEYLGFDDFEVQSQALSAKDNQISGFAFTPNPTQGALRLKANTILDKATVYDILGKELMDVKGNSREINLDLANFTSGIYLVKVKSGETSQTIKVIRM